ncbi:MAG: hypothetical protein U0694_09195 [Anaerolineae bacterium]
MLLLLPVTLLALDRLHLLSDVEFSRLGMYSCAAVGFGTVLLLILFTDLRMRRRRYSLLARHEEKPAQAERQSLPYPNTTPSATTAKSSNNPDKAKHSEKPYTSPD